MEKYINHITYSTQPELLNIPLIHTYLSTESYWARHIPLEVVETAIKNSICFGAYSEHGQVAFARVITDHATFGYLADVFVLGDYRKRGIAKNLMEFIMEVTSQLNLRRFMLATLDAHTLYTQYGFTELQHPERLMEINRPGIYGDAQNPCN
jgi:N-acetylglutamate synthase-like GNAT family acetyltransferase